MNIVRKFVWLLLTLGLIVLTVQTASPIALGLAVCMVVLPLLYLPLNLLAAKKLKLSAKLPVNLRKNEDGTVELTNEPMSLRALIREVSVIEGEHASEAGVTLESDTKSNLPYPYVYGSPLHLRQIFLNIYSNSIKYNKPGGKIYSSVECLSADSKTVTYRWTISATGIGMSEEFL